MDRHESECRCGPNPFCVRWLPDQRFARTIAELSISLARAEQILRRQAELIGLSHDAIVTTGADRRITGWNAGAEEMYGWRETEATGKVTHTLLQTTSAVSTARMDEILQQEGQWNGELEPRYTRRPPPGC